MKITNTYEYQKMRGLKRKIELIELRGGCCEKCGYNKNIASFDFHHKDPSQKNHKLDMRKLSNTSMVELMKEFEKCELLCSNCHRETHFPDLEFLRVKEIIKEINNSVIEIKLSGKPKCVDCGCVINYTHKRCKPCSDYNKRKVIQPDLKLLISEVSKYSQEWCAEKYGISRSTIRRWLKKK